MQLTYEDSLRLKADDELAEKQTENIPFFGFAAGTILALGLWGWIVWTVWVLVS